MSDPIRIDSTSADSAAAVAPVVLWTSPSGRRRLGFSPNIHHNPNIAAAVISGELRYQSKRAAGEFTDEDSLVLTSLRAGEWTRYQLSSEALLELYRVLTGLYELHSSRGVPRRQYLMVPVDDEMVEAADSGAIRDVTAWLIRSADPAALASALTALGPDETRYIGAASASAALTALLADWDSHSDSNEREWHQLLARHEWVVEQVLGQPLLLFQNEAVVSSPTVDRKKAAYVDFMCRNPHTNAIALVEIKRADTALLQNQPYRGEAYAVSGELSGGVAQSQYYRATFQRDIETLMRDTPHLTLVTPRSVLVIGNTASLDDNAKRASFERFRAGVNDVEVLTFDELRSRVEGFLGILEGGAPGGMGECTGDDLA
ncbi:MAG TPA: Shedu immune nuclease family protein [Myxococcota bacterium]|nr:Shedu immune nuclease family protein [Myxococcota bacterium]